MNELCFWLLTGVGIGILIAHTWELILGMLGATFLIAMFVVRDPDLMLIPAEWPFSGTRTLRWFIRTSLAILAALITSILVPFQEQREKLMEHPQALEIIAATVVTALLIAVLTLRIDPVNRLLLKLHPENEEMKDSAAK